MQTKSFNVDSLESLENELLAIKMTDFQPTIAVVFASIKHDLNALVSIFDKYEIDLLGCSSGGEIQDDTIMEKQLVVLLITIDKTHYKIYHEDVLNDDIYQASYNIGQLARHAFKKSSIIAFSGGIQLDGQEIVTGIKDGSQQGTSIFGGLAGDDLEMSETFAFSNKWVSDAGLVALILDGDKVEIEGMAVSGWESLGTVHQITKITKNILYEINEQPALDFFMKYFNFHTKQNQGDLNTISGQFPIQVIRKDSSIVVRSILYADTDNRSLVLAGSGIEKGDQFKFSVAPNFDVIQQTVEEFGHLKNRCPQADAMILVSCKGRETSFGPCIEEEVEGIYQQWQVPMVGLFSYGEIGTTKNGNPELHNITCSLILLKEI